MRSKLNEIKKVYVMWKKNSLELVVHNQHNRPCPLLVEHQLMMTRDYSDCILVQFLDAIEYSGYYYHDCY